MIKLERLRVEGFKCLSGIDLSFPSRCHVLIEGQNEAGKSTLFESIYFALYGDTFKEESRQREQSSAIRHGLSEASVALTLWVGDTQLEIKRSILTHHQTAQLIVTYPGRDPETVSSVQSVNTRIIRELEGLDGEALLNSCFVEQKRLDKLEGLDRARREQVLLKLLNMDRLTRLSNAFTWRGEDEHELDVARDKLCLVQAARELSQARKQQAQVERQLKLVAFHVDLDEIDRQDEIIQKRSAERERKEIRANRLDEQLARLACQKSAETALLAIQRGLDTSAHYKAEIQRLQKELDELDRLERDELQGKRVELERLKALQSRLAEIQRLKDARGRANAEQEQLESILSLASRQKEPRKKLTALPDEEKAARDAAENARRRRKAAQTIEALQRWMIAYRAHKALADADEKIESAQEQARIVRGRQATLEREKTSKAMRVAAALLAIGLIAGGIGFSFTLTLLWPVAAALVVTSVIAGLLGLRKRRRLKAELATCDTQLQECKRIVQEQERCRETVIGQKPPALDTCLVLLDELEVDIPESEQEAGTAIAVLENDLGGYDTNALLRSVSDAQSKLLVLVERRQGKGLAGIGVVKNRIRALRQHATENEIAIKEKWAAIADELKRLDFMQETDLMLNRLAERIGGVANEIEKLKERIEGRGKLRRQQNEWQDRITAERNKIQEQYNLLAELSDKAGLPIVVPTDDAVPQVLTDIRQALRKQNPDRLKRDRRAVQQAIASAQAAIDQAKSAIVSAKANVQQKLVELKLPVPAEPNREALAALEPEFANGSAADQDKLQKEAQNCMARFQSLSDQVDRLEYKIGVQHSNLNEKACHSQVEAQEERKAVCFQAATIINRVRERMLSQVLPGTIAYMQSLLPLLTAGRYHDVDLDPANYKIRVWDANAGEQGEYVEKDFFSGGTQDQFSLALRLGFALATLPQEAGDWPGFIFLDEPLSAFDRQRTTALVKLLTGGPVAKCFDQILLIAHDRSFENCPFPYHMRLEEGQIVEHNLNRSVPNNPDLKIRE